LRIAILVIWRAAADLHHVRDDIRDDAWEWWLSDQAAFMIASLGLDPVALVWGVLGTDIDRVTRW
jgi:hypothetical protein